MAWPERSTIVGVFDDLGQAQQALEGLRHAGFSDEQLGLLARNASEGGTDAGVAPGAMGAATGAVLGGTVGSLSTHKTKIRGTEHLMAMVETKQKDKLQRIAVDLGRADRLKMDVKKGSALTFSGFPVKVTVKGNAKPLIVAQSVTQDDKTVQLNCQPSKSSAAK